MDAKRPTQRHIIIKMLKVKDKERILKAAREKQLPTGEFSQDCHLISQKKLCRIEIFHWQEILKVMKQGPTAKIALSSKGII